MSLFSCIGYFDDELSDQIALQALASALRPGGKILLSLANGPVVARMDGNQTVFEHGEFKIEQIDTYDAGQGCLERQFLVLDRRSGEQRTICHRRRLYSPDELAAVFERCGIIEVGRASDYHGAPFVPDRSPHAIYLGCRRT